MHTDNNFILSCKKNTNPLIPSLKRKIVGKTMLFTNARNEKNMKEWVAHHLLLGFDLIYIFDHKSKIPLENELVCFKNKVVVVRCEIDGAIKMYLMMKAAKLATAIGADWMLYLDADEFLVLNAFQNIKQMLCYYLFADSLAINWLLFGTNHLSKEPDQGLLIENYTLSDLKIDKHVKTFVRPSQVVSAVTPHYFAIANPNKMVSINMQLMKDTKSFNEWDIEYTRCAAFIAHYVYQSEESYIKRKVNLPRDDNNQHRQPEQNIHAKHNSVKNDLVKEKYAENIHRLLDKVKKLKSDDK
jgi:hypothetical protein